MGMLFLWACAQPSQQTTEEPTGSCPNLRESGGVDCCPQNELACPTDEQTVLEEGLFSSSGYSEETQRFPYMYVDSNTMTSATLYCKSAVRKNPHLDSFHSTPDSCPKPQTRQEVYAKPPTDASSFVSTKSYNCVPKGDPVGSQAHDIDSDGIARNTGDNSEGRPWDVQVIQPGGTAQNYSCASVYTPRTVYMAGYIPLPGSPSNKPAN